jgi:uncharacterized membrane protein (UPF0127 family)
MKKTLISLGIIIVLGVGVFLSIRALHKNNESLPISAVLKTETGQEIQLRVANNEEERHLGLSYFKSLPQDQGMLFLFDKPGIYPFWMKGMNFPLDIIWLKRGQGSGYRVVYVAKNVSPSSYPASINPEIEADAVLEINSNLSTVYNLDLEKNLWISSKK